MELARDQLFSYFRVISSLVLREMSARFGSKPGGYIWALLDPVSHVALLTLVFMAFSRVPPLGNSFPLFFATGYFGYLFYSGTLTYVSRSLSANRSLLSYPAIAPIDFVTARFVLQVVTTALVSLIIIFLIVADLHFETVIRWERILEAIVAISILGLGASLFNSVVFPQSPLYEKIFMMVNRPLMLISGVFYLPDSIPLPYRDYLGWNPLCHAIMLFRSGFYDKYEPQMLDMGYLYICALTALLVGLAMFTMLRDVVRNQ